MSRWKSDSYQGSLARRWILLVVVLIFFASAALSVFQLMREFRPDRGEVRGTVLWVATEVNREYGRLLDAISLYSNGDPGIEQDDLLLRLDLLWSQLNNFQTGAIGERLSEIIGEDPSLSDFLGLLEEVEPDLLALQYGDQAGGIELRQKLSVFLTPVHRLVQKVDKAGQEYLQQVSFRTERSLQILAFLLFSMAMSAGILIYFLISETRRASAFSQRAQQAEATVRQANEQLEEKIRERTSDLETEIAERKAVEDDLRSAEERFRQIFEAAKVANFVTSADGTIEASNSAAQDMFGYSETEMSGRNLSSLISPNVSNPEADESEQPSLLDQSGMEFKGTNQDGSHLDVFMTAGRIPISGRDLFVVSINDLTEQKQLQSQLAQSRRLETIGQLTGGVAHDFNNLLAIVLGNLELLQRDTRDNAKLALLDDSITAILRGSELTKNMLSFARKAPLEPRLTDLNDVVGSMRDLISRVLPSSIQVETHLAADLWPIKVDPSTTESALLNLIINARDASPEGGKISIGTQNIQFDERFHDNIGDEIEPGRYALLMVSDSGQGIAADNLQKIFEPFFTTKPVGSGSGLGLSMLQGFMRQSGGAVLVYSELGVGTTFKLYFPAATPATTGTDNWTSSETAVYEKPENKTILLVEDHPQVLAITQATLERSGYRVLTAASGDTAKTIFEREPEIDLVLTDMVMPGKIQGVDLYWEVRKSRPELPIILMSGYASEGPMTDFPADQNLLRIMKPVPSKDLLATVAQLLTQQPVVH